ncbi:MAG: hypothetical protein KDC44_13195, partial [Phaeodactylibacter sp.]|nr:hypothetical protein [Phaeodactylibacter sp.]
WATCWGSLQVIDCQNDTEVPVAICKQQLNVELGYDGPNQTVVWATDLDDGSYDFCTANLLYRMELGITPSATPPSTENFTFTDAYLGLNDVVLWVGDAAGNWSQCICVVNILTPQCADDVNPPLLSPPAAVQILASDFLALGIDPFNVTDLDNNFGTATAVDNCELGQIQQSVAVTMQSCIPGTPMLLERTFVAYDTAGNASLPGTQWISVVPEYSFHVPGYFEPGDPMLDSLTYTDGPYATLASALSDLNYDFDCDDQIDFIERDWTLVNWCNFINNTPATFLPALDLNGDQVVGDPYDVIVLADSAYLYENGQVGIGLAPRAEYYSYTQEIRYNYLDTVELWMLGKVFLDENMDCSFDAEPVLEGWPVKIVGMLSGETITTYTNALGQYAAQLCANDTVVEVSLDLPYDYGQSCPTTYTVLFTGGGMQAEVQDIPVQLDNSCPLLLVDVSAPFLRRCMENYYAVSYINLSDQFVPDAHVEVLLDDDMTFTSASLPGVPLGNNSYQFSIGDLDPGQSGQFHVFADLDCNVVLGATHCTEAYIYPDTLCPMLANWSGANIEVEGYCANDSIYLRIENTGTGNMDGPLEFIVVEDVIMFLQDTFNLGMDDDALVLAMPSSGSTWRLEAEQEPDHPYIGNVSVAVEGCGGINELGLVNLFPLNNPNPFIAVDCQQNIGSFDPNDKLAYPEGYGADHYIEREVGLEYKIRFQNTGTDTAF